MIRWEFFEIVAGCILEAACCLYHLSCWVWKCFCGRISSSVSVVTYHRFTRL